MNIRHPPDEERRTSQQLQNMPGKNNTAPNGITSPYLTTHGTTPPCWSRKHYTSHWQGNTHSSTETREQLSWTTPEVRFLMGIDVTPTDPCRVQDLYYWTLDLVFSVQAMFCACCVCSDEDCRIVVKMSAFYNKAFGWNKGYFVTMNNSQPRTSLHKPMKRLLVPC